MSINKKYILQVQTGEEKDMSMKFDTEEEAQYKAMELTEAIQVQLAAEIDEGELYEAPEPTYFDIIEFVEPSFMNSEIQEQYRLRLEEEERQKLLAEEAARLAEEEEAKRSEEEMNNIPNIEEEIIEEEVVEEEIIEEENNENKGENE